MEIFNLVVLGLSGLLLTYAGGNRLRDPAASFCLQTYLKKPGVELAEDADMLSEMRGMGSYTLLAGLLAFTGIVVPNLRVLSFGVAAVIFVGYAIGRVVSRIKDGTPNRDTVNGTVFESVFGVLNLGGLVALLA